MNNNKIEWLTPKSFEKRYEITEQTQAIWRMKEKIPFYKIGRFIRYDADEIDRWLKTHKVFDGVENHER